MVRRSTGIVLGFFVILLILALALQRDRASQAVQATPLPTTALLLEPRGGGIGTLAITVPGGGRVELIRQGEEWRLSDLPAGLTDQGRVTSAVSQLETIALSRTFSDRPELGTLGLDEPAYTLTISWNGGLQEQVLVGDQTPTQDGYYVQRPGGEISVVNQFAMDMVLDLLRNPPLAPTPFPSPAATLAPGP